MTDTQFFISEQKTHNKNFHNVHIYDTQRMQWHRLERFIVSMYSNVIHH